MSGAIRVGVSSCLLGEKVRFDGGHKRDAYVSDTLARYFEFVPLCPEMAIGLGQPREPIRLIRVAGEVRVRGVRTADLDVTEPLRDYGRRIAGRLRGLSGFIFNLESSVGRGKCAFAVVQGKAQRCAMVVLFKAL